MGSWRWPYLSQQLTLTTVISSNELKIIADCRFNGVSLSATAASGAIIDDTSIRALGDAFHKETINGTTCEANIKAGTLSYVLRPEDSLEITAPGEAPLTLTRL